MIVNPKIFDYIEQCILPKYESFDKAHGREHVDRVIENSLSIASDYDVDVDKVYVIAAYHDIGLHQGRENHEKHSAEVLRSDSKLEKWFSKDEIILMSEAIEDHRASNDYVPRNIYGKIVSEADRDLDYIIILTRIVQYSLEHFPNYTLEQHYARAYDHMQKKYGENGYLKLWLDTEINRKNLSMIRSALRSEERFKTDFVHVFNKCSEEALY